MAGYKEPEITEAKEFEPATDVLDISQSLAIGLTRAEIDQQISTARAYPRQLKVVIGRIMSLATLDEESAEECIYALPRGGKPIQGPSIRFAEILKQAFGNCRTGARVVHVDRVEKYVEAEGVFHDLETNSLTSARVRRRISDKRGRLFSDDMIIVTGNAACSIAQRNAILGGVPKPLWRRAYESVQSAIAGDITTLAENRVKAIKAFAHYGVKPEQVYKALGVAGDEDITVDHIGVMRGMFSALKNGESTVEEMFFGTVRGANHERVQDPLSDELVDPQTGEILDDNSQGASGTAREAPSTDIGTATETPAVGTMSAPRFTQTEGDDNVATANSKDIGKIAAKEVGAANIGLSEIAADKAAVQALAIAGSASEEPSGLVRLGGSEDPSVTPEEMAAYSQALMRGEQAKSLPALKEQFWKGKPNKFNEASKAKLKEIYTIHLRRIASEVDIGAFDRAIARTIAS